MNTRLIGGLRLNIKTIEGNSDSLVFFCECDRNCLVADLAGSSHDVAALVTLCQLRT